MPKEDIWPWLRNDHPMIILIYIVHYQSEMGVGSLLGTKTSSHYDSSRGFTSNTYRFFRTWRFFLCPTRVQTKAEEGMERISCRCLAPLLLHLRREAGMGILMRVPESMGLLEITLIFNSSARPRIDLSSIYLSAKASGIIMLIYMNDCLQVTERTSFHESVLLLVQQFSQYSEETYVTDDFLLLLKITSKTIHTSLFSHLVELTIRPKKLYLAYFRIPSSPEFYYLKT